MVGHVLTAHPDSPMSARIGRSGRPIGPAKPRPLSGRLRSLGESGSNATPTNASQFTVSLVYFMIGDGENAPADPDDRSKVRSDGTFKVMVGPEKQQRHHCGLRVESDNVEAIFYPIADFLATEADSWRLDDACLPE